MNTSLARTPTWQIRGPYEGAQKFALIERVDDGSLISRGMFATRAEARARHRHILAERGKLELSA